MEFTATETKRCQLVRVGGHVDSSVAPELQRHLEALTSAGHHRLVANLADVTFLSSAGIRSLVGTLSACRKAHGDLRLSELSAPVARVLELTSLDMHFKIYPSDVEAVGSF